MILEDSSDSHRKSPMPIARSLPFHDKRTVFATAALTVLVDAHNPGPHHGGAFFMWGSKLRPLKVHRGAIFV